MCRWFGHKLVADNRFLDTLGFTHRCTRCARWSGDAHNEWDTDGA